MDTPFNTETRASEFIIGKLFYEVDPTLILDSFAKTEYQSSIMLTY